eukprot:TRINITY_DN15627_c0_g1_i1.p1 TRINITY_DN15627_c0_g1~~TRINITY_DN15627_c0_g1_i1.p1  ORF type:complete len:557 (+),score=87.55 TRINITY_DN15627_c0_g1_i1:221-1672(+)
MADGAQEYGIGLDLEWQPSFYTNNTTPSATSLIQLATENVAVIFWMTHLQGAMPAELKRLLMDPAVRKFGFGLGKEDTARLSSEFDGAALVNAIDVANEAKTYGFQRSGLKSMTESLLGVQLSKAQRTANWGAFTLAQEQIHYAATDAYLSLLLYYKLKAIVASVLDKTIDQSEVFGTDSVKLLAPFAKKAPMISNASSQQLLTAVGAPPRPTFKCPTCDKKFGAENAYNDHVFTSKHGEPTIKVEIPPGAVKFCPGCRKRYDTDDAYVKHILATRHDVPESNPNALPWLPEVITSHTGHRTIKFVNGTSVTRELSIKPFALSHDDFLRRKDRIDAFSKRNSHMESVPEPAPAPARSPAAQTSTAHSLPAPAPTPAPVAEAAGTITIELAVYNKMKQDIESLTRQLSAEKKRTADLRSRLNGNNSAHSSPTKSIAEGALDSPVAVSPRTKAPKPRLGRPAAGQRKYKAKKASADPKQQPKQDN